MERNNNQAQALLNLHCRMFAFENLTAEYKDNTKALKLCLKFIKVETKELNKCSEVSSYDKGEIAHRYEVLTDIVKRLLKSPAAAKNAAIDNLRTLTENTQKDISELREQLSPFSENVRKLTATLDGAAQKLSEKLESGTQIISEKVNEAVDEIKKRLKQNEE